MFYSTATLTLLERLRTGAEREARESGTPATYSLVELLPIILDALAKFLPLLAHCKQQPPPTPPLPAALAAVGVTPETWRAANVSKFAAAQSVKPDGTLYPTAVNRAAKEIALQKKLKKKPSKPLAISAIRETNATTAEALAVALQQIKNSAA